CSPSSATCHCLSVPPISASQCRLSVLVPPISAIYQCCLSVPISDACQCPSVPPSSVSSSVPISATYQCPSVQPIIAHHCSLISAHH
ncbi:unnamed protein product, partial [Staurois parvus]